jgi:mRNA interferase MazF
MKRGEIWIVQFDPVRGHEQGLQRPALIVSADAWNGPPGHMVTVLPVTSKPRKLPSRVRVKPPEGGLNIESWIICEQVRTISTQRLGRPLGSVTLATMQLVSDNVRMLLDL